MTLTGEEFDLPALAREGFTSKINLGLVNLGAAAVALLMGHLVHRSMFTKRRDHTW